MKFRMGRIGIYAINKKKKRAYIRIIAVIQAFTYAAVLPRPSLSITGLSNAQIKQNASRLNRSGAHIGTIRCGTASCVFARGRRHASDTRQRRRNENSWIKGPLARHVPRGITRGLKNPDSVAHLFCPPGRRSACLRSCCAPVGTDVRLTQLQVSPPSFIHDCLSFLFLSLSLFFL